MTGRLNNKVAIITGSTGGIGKAMAARFLAEGACVMLTGRTMDRLEAVKTDLGGGDAVVCHAAQPASEDDVKALVQATLKVFGQVNIMCANAGMEGAVAPITLLDAEEFDAVQTANVRSAFLAIKHGGLAMQAHGGAIIAMSSVAGVVGVPGIGAYAASKHAISGLVKVAAAELAPAKVRVNAIAPAPIDNDMMRAIEGKASPDDPSLAKTGFTGLIPMGRYGTNEEVANLAAFLASDEASFCTGQVYAADGGFLAV